GPLFFASTTKFIQSFDHVTENAVVINFENSQIWDESAVAAIIKVKQKLEQKGVAVQIHGLNSSSEQLYQQFT
ncbi:sodium-independent anion transporter, partial [Microvirga sp. 3-52]|nr:sodium-independent anion transporter [Microvirga sp. 3-52]